MARQTTTERFRDFAERLEKALPGRRVIPNPNDLTLTIDGGSLSDITIGLELDALSTAEVVKLIFDHAEARRRHQATPTAPEGGE